MQDEHLRPNVDYTLTWSLSQTTSISELAAGKREAAAISDDKLQALLKKGKVSESDYRIIYKSDVIPRTTVGYFYNLNPQLAAKIHDAILAYRDSAPAPASKASTQPAGDTSADDSADATGAFHFIPVDYKKDFQLVRLIDDSFDPRLNARKLAQQQSGN
jgi:phosphonate transport system substrate-binding protein